MRKPENVAEKQRRVYGSLRRLARPELESGSADQLELEGRDLCEKGTGSELASLGRNLLQSYATQSKQFSSKEQKSFWQGCGGSGTFTRGGEDVKWCRRCGKQFGIPQSVRHRLNNSTPGYAPKRTEEKH